MKLKSSISRRSNIVQISKPDFIVTLGFWAVRHMRKRQNLASEKRNSSFTSSEIGGAAMHGGRDAEDLVHLACSVCSFSAQGPGCSRYKSSITEFIFRLLNYKMKF